MKNKPYFLHCQDLIVRTDISHSSHPDFKQIAMIECRAYREGRQCLTSGNCVIAREEDTWKKISKKSFGEKK